MAIISFPGNTLSYEDLPELSELDGEALLSLQQRIQEEIAALDKKEPKNEASEAYEQWADRHEELEDMLDEILDALEDL